MKYKISGNSQDYIKELISTTQSLDPKSIENYANELYNAWLYRKTVYVCGNGGSAYTASHHVTDYIKTASVEGQPRLKAISLSDNIGLLTALGNDISYDSIFQFPFESFFEEGDILIAISCSGNSPNVLRALESAQAKNIKTIGITGFKGGKMKDLSDIHVNVPSENYGVIEDLQMSIGHIGSQILKTRILKSLEEKKAA